jgi:predicted aldo/keto reductase-like oxidoreductase
MNTAHVQSGILHSPYSVIHTSFGRPVCRLGLATRGEGKLQVADVLHALDRGVNFLNWCGQPDALSAAVSAVGSRRRDLVVCVQFEARTTAEAKVEVASILRELHTDYVDVLTLYYVEALEEWRQLIGPGGALDFCRAAQRAGQVRLIGLTTHQRPLAAEAARSGMLDLLMIRYNAAHRGAETEVFPITDALAMPVVAFTCLRWGELLRSTPDDPPGFQVPCAPAWYRYVLQSPSVTVAIMAPENRAELDEDLSVLDLPARLTMEEYAELMAHGRRVRRHAGRFP